MEKCEPTIEGKFENSNARVSSSEVDGADVQAIKKGNEESVKAMNREEALQKLREIALKNSSYEMDGDEIERVREIAERCDPNDTFLFLRIVETIDSLKKGSFEEGAIN